LTRRLTRIIREGEYAAEVNVHVTDDAGGWSPCLTVDEAFRLDDVREALRSGDINHALKKGRVYHLTPVDA
jgi:hypothetical protein